MRLRTLAVPVLACLLSGASYNIPPNGFLLSNDQTKAGGRQVARDSKGFWYVVWGTTTGNTGDVILSYTTTTTPTAATDWSYVTLVKDGGGGVISAPPANSADGGTPSLAMTHDDQLFVGWRMGFTFSLAGYYSSKCSNLSALTVSSSWTTPTRIDNTVTGNFGPSDLSLVLDERDVPHAAFRFDQNGLFIGYAKYDAATTAWLTPRTVVATSTLEVALTTDTENNVYLAYRASVDQKIYLLASQDADTTDPASSTWMNLAQTTTAADLVSPVNGAALGGPDCVVDRNGILHVLWVDGGIKDPISREGTIRDGWGAADAAVVATTSKSQAKLCAAANGDVYGFFALASGGSADDIHQLLYTASTDYRQYGAWSTATTNIEDRGSNGSEIFLTQHRLWPQDTKVLWMVEDGNNEVLSTSWTNSPASTAHWKPPRPTKNQTHPHLTWVFPNSQVSLGSQALPVASQYSKGTVYCADTSTAYPRVYAVDRDTGGFARSYSLANQATGMIAAAYAGNVHLFVENFSRLTKLVDNGNAVVLDTTWANNPKFVPQPGSSAIRAELIFRSEPGGRFLYTIPDHLGTLGRLGKLYADNGNDVAGFPVAGGSQYTQNVTQGILRILNDQIFIPGYSTQIYRRETDGSGEIVSSAVANAVKQALLVRGTGKNLFLAPVDKMVWRLDSGLKTTGWTGGRSANLGVVKTSGAYYTDQKDFLYVGAGNQLYRLNVSDGALVSNWPMATPGNIVTLPVAWRTFVYFGTDSGRLYAVNATTNVARANWPVVLDTFVSSPKATALAFDAIYGQVYFGTDEGRIYKLTLE